MSASTPAPKPATAGPEPGAAAPPPRPASPLPQGPLLRCWIGASISLRGDPFYLVALPWVVLQLTGSGVAMGTVAMAAGIPRAVLMLLGGAVTDRSSPRRLLMATATARTILVAVPMSRDRKSTRLNSSHFGISYAVLF